jgi:hypothetical protein
MAASVAELQVDPVQEEINRGQRRLIDACMKVPLQPGGHAISAYVNSTLLGAQVAALVEYTAPFELDSEGAPMFEQSVKEAPRIQIAGLN